MERIQTGIKLHELETTMAVYYSYLESDHGQKWNKPSHCLTKHYNHSKLGLDALSYAPGRRCQVEQIAWKHRWINVYTDFRERDGNYLTSPALPTCPRNRLCARTGALCVCRWLCRDAARVKPASQQLLLPLGLLARLRKMRENVPSVAQHRLVETFN